jgi:TolA-binding protein
MRRAHLLAAAVLCVCRLAPAQPPDDADYRAATGLLQRGIPDQAAVEYRAFLKDHPDHPKAAEARYGLAVCLTQLGQWKEAGAELATLEGQSSFEFAPDALLIGAQCALQMNDAARAEGALRSLLERYPKFEKADTACEILGETLYRAGRWDDASATLARVAEEWPKSSSRPRSDFFLASAQAAKGDDRAAAARFERWRAAWPQDPLASRVALAEAQSRHRLAIGDGTRVDQEEAQRSLALYEASSTDDAGKPVIDAMIGRAQLLRAIGKPAEAARLLEQIVPIATGPTLATARVEQARAYLDEGKPEQGLASIERGAAPRDPLSLYWAAKCELALLRFDAAAQRLEQAAAAHPDVALLPSIAYDRALALGRGGHTDGALAAFSDFRAKFQGHPLAPDALASEASLSLAKHDGAAAAQLCNEFLQRYPKHARADAVRLTLADAQIAQGDAEHAEGLFAAYLRDHAADPSARGVMIRRGLALAKLGRVDEAEKALQAGLESKGQVDSALVLAARLVMADSALARSDWVGAERALRPIEHRDADADLKLAISLLRQNHGAEAAPILAKLAGDLQAGAARKQALFERGQLAAEQGRYDDARADFESVVKLERADRESRFTAHALRHLAAIASKEGRADEAAALLGEVAQTPDGTDALYEQGVALLAAGKHAQATAAFEQLLRATPASPKAADSSAQLAVVASRAGQYDRCLELSDRAASAPGLSPDVRASMRYERAWALKELRRTDEAERAFKDLLEDPAATAFRAHAVLSLAQLRIAAEDYAGALPMLATLASPGSSEDRSVSAHAAYLRAVCELKTDHPAEAAAAAEHLLQSKPDEELVSPAALLAGEAELALKRPDAAVPYLNRAVDSRPSPEVLGPALLCLGEALGSSQRWDESRAAFERFNSEFPRSDLWFQARFGIAWSLENQGRQAEAIQAYREVVGRHKGPTAARAQFQIGECLFALKQHDEAVRELLKVDILYSYPEWSAAALYEAGRSLIQLHKPDEARKQFAQVVERFKDTEWATLAGRELATAAPETLPGASTH